MIREMGNETKPTSNAKGKSQQGIARRDFLVGCRYFCIGGGTIALDIGLKTKSAKDIVKDILAKGKESLTPSKEFIALLDKLGNAKESVVAEKTRSRYC